MGSSLTIEETTSLDDIMYVLSNPKIWAAITFDDQSVDDAVIPFGDEHIYLITKHEGLRVGVNYFHYLNPKMVEFHPSVLPIYRPEYSHLSVRLGMDWMFNTTDIEKITVQIPECFNAVIRFAKIAGFTEEGLITNGYPKGREMINIHLLGLTRSEWADL